MIRMAMQNCLKTMIEIEATWFNEVVFTNPTKKNGLVRQGDN